MNGFINFIKPPGMSSAQAVFFVKRLLQAKVGHAGTLDPEAAGALPLMVGRGTKLFDYITDDNKVYLAEIAFGTATDTQDAQGQVVARSSKIPSMGALEAVLPQFVGTIHQTPPMYSALQQGGKRLYELAREGKQVEISARPIEVYEISDIQQRTKDSFLLRIRCGKGTYIRTLCQDIGKALGCPAHMRFLLRERVGDFTIENGITPEELKEFIAQGVPTVKWLHEPDQYLNHLPQLDVPQSLQKPLINGVSLNIQDIPGGASLPENIFVRLYLNKQFICISQRTGQRLPMRTMYHIGPALTV